MKYLFIVLLLCQLLAGFAQTYPADSLNLLLKSEMADSSKVLIMADLAETYWYTNPDSSFSIAQEGYRLARQINFVRGEAQCLRNIGVILDLSGDYPAALDHYLQALKKFESLNDLKGIIKVYVDIGAVYGEQGDYKPAVSYTWKSKSLAESSGRYDLLMYALNNLGDFYEKMNLLDSARIYTNQAFELSVRYNWQDIGGITLNNLGNIHSKMKQRTIAMGYYHQSYSYFKDKNDYEALCETTLGMAMLFAESGESDSALYYSRISLASANMSGFIKRKLNAASFLTTFFKEKKMVDSAFHYQGIAMAAKDSLFSQEKVRKVQNLNFLEQIRQQEMAEAKLQAREKRVEKIQMLGVGTFIPFFFGILVLSGKRTRKRRTIRFLGLLGILLLFEFIAYILDPMIVNISLGIPVLNLLCYFILASLLVPVDDIMQDWVNEKLAPDLEDSPREWK